MSGVIDVGVVGAGPAGLAAALTAGGLGCEVTLIDTASGPGGQRYRPDTLLPGRGQPPAEHLPPQLARFRQVKQGRYLAATTVSHAARGSDGVVTLWVGGPEGGAETTVEVRAVVLATGADELVLPFPGWDLPGVTTTGAAQALLQGQGVTVGRRVLVGGSGPWLRPVAASLAQAGVQVVAVLEAMPALAGLSRYDGPVLTGHAVVGCLGTDRVERAVIARLDEDWRPVPGSRREEAVDAVHLSFGSSPALELPRALGCAEVPPTARPTAAVACDTDQATSVPGVFAAGEVTGASGADAAELEGYLAGLSAARYLGRLDPAGYAERSRPLRAQRLAARLDASYPLRPGWLEWPDDDTVACRCEQTRWGAVRAAVAAGARDVAAVSQATGCGLGYCQARVCGPALRYAVSLLAAGQPLPVTGAPGPGRR